MRRCLCAVLLFFALIGFLIQEPLCVHASPSGDSGTAWESVPEASGSSALDSAAADKVSPDRAASQKQKLLEAMNTLRSWGLSPIGIIHDLRNQSSGTPADNDQEFSGAGQKLRQSAEEIGDSALQKAQDVGGEAVDSASRTIRKEAESVLSKLWDNLADAVRRTLDSAFSRV